MGHYEKAAKEAAGDAAKGLNDLITLLNDRNAEVARLSGIIQKANSIAYRASLEKSDEEERAEAEEELIRLMLRARA